MPINRTIVRQYKPCICIIFFDASIAKFNHATSKDDCINDEAALTILLDAPYLRHLVDKVNNICKKDPPLRPLSIKLIEAKCWYQTTIVLGLRPQSTFLFIVSHFEWRAYEIVKWELNKLILCDMSAFEQEYSQVCL